MRYKYLHRGWLEAKLARENGRLPAYSQPTYLVVQYDARNSRIHIPNSLTKIIKLLSKKSKKKNNRRRRNRKQLATTTIVVKEQPVAKLDPLGNKTKGKRRQRMQPPTGYSMCGQKYLLALADPWHPNAAGACVPRFPSRPSQKVTAFMRVTPVTNAQGEAYVLISPSLANDAAFCWFTANNLASSSAFAIVANANATTSTTGVAAGLMTDLPYSSANLTSNNNSGSAAVGRIISVGVSIQAISGASSIGGLYTLYEEPLHDNINGQSFVTLQSKREATVKRITQEKEWINMAPVSETELEYANAQYLSFGSAGVMPSIFPWSGSEYLDQASYTDSYNNGGCPLAILITGAPTQQSYNVEIIMHAEYVGKNADALTTPNSIDTKAVEHGVAAAQKAQGTRNDVNTTYAQSFVQGLKAVAREAAPLAKEILKSYTRSGRRRNSHMVEF